MRDSDKLKKVITDRIQQEDDTLKKIAKLIEISPIIQQQKDEDQTSLELINTMPEDFVEEMSGRWLSLELERKNFLEKIWPDLPEINPNFVPISLTSASGTASPYITSGSNLVQSFILEERELPDWANHTSIIVNNFTSKVEQRNYLPGRLNIINSNLGDLFIIAQNTFRKCQNNIIGVDLCAIHLRDVIQQLWGGLTAKASSINTNKRINTSGLKLKKPGDRDLVAEILSKEIFSKNRMILLFSDLYNLHYKLSDTRFGKNPLNKDVVLLKSYYNQWLSLIDAISAISI